MSPLVAFFVGAPIWFVAGVFARPALLRIVNESREQMTHAKPTTKWSRTWDKLTATGTIMVLLAVAVLTSCGALIYVVTNERADDACLTNLLQQSGRVQTVRSKVADQSDRALRRWVMDPTPDNEARFIAASMKLAATRVSQPIPTWDELCRQVAEGKTFG